MFVTKEELKGQGWRKEEPMYILALDQKRLLFPVDPKFLAF